jgi:hypothetical protein
VTRTIVRLGAWWLALAWGWLLLVGEWNGTEWIAAAIAGLVAAIAAEIVHRQGLLPFRFSAGSFGGIASVPKLVVVDFWLLTLALLRAAARRRRPRGLFRARRFDAGAPDDDGDRARRAVAGLLATYSPNAYVVEVDAERQLALVHDLVPYRDSERPL